TWERPDTIQPRVRPTAHHSIVRTERKIAFCVVVRGHALRMRIGTEYVWLGLGLSLKRQMHITTWRAHSRAPPYTRCRCSVDA
ncbi:unnamed protein product, partial [Pylaiella littoralis]